MLPLKSRAVEFGAGRVSRSTSPAVSCGCRVFRENNVSIPQCWMACVDDEFVTCVARISGAGSVEAALKATTRVSSWSYGAPHSFWLKKTAMCIVFTPLGSTGTAPPQPRSIAFRKTGSRDVVSRRHDEVIGVASCRKPRWPPIGSLRRSRARKLSG